MPKQQKDNLMKFNKSGVTMFVTMKFCREVVTVRSRAGENSDFAWISR